MERQKPNIKFYEISIKDIIETKKILLEQFGIGDSPIKYIPDQYADWENLLIEEPCSFVVSAISLNFDEYQWIQFMEKVITVNYQ